MCLIFFALKNHPNYKLIVAANRDEFYRRKTSPAGYWKDYPNVLGGRDLEANGTWMAINQAGKIGLITNYRASRNHNPQAPSRGQLVSDYLINPDLPGEYLKKVEGKASRYNGFNLIVGNPDELWYLSNYQKGIEQIAPGFYGISNHLLETPWPKVLRGKAKLAPALLPDIISVEHVFEVLYDDQRASDELLPDTGIGLERERVLSPIFIKTKDYGSRSSTVILIDHQNHVLFSERVFDLTTYEFTTKSFEYQIKP